MRRPGVAAGYGLVVLATVATWQLGSAASVASVAFIGAALTAALYADFSKLKATMPGGGSLELEREAAVEDALAAVVDTVPDPEELTDPAVAAADDTVKSSVFPEGLARMLERAKEYANEREIERRAALERLVAEAAEWGWALGNKGARQPEPRLDWSEDGRPRLVRHDPEAELRMRAIRQILSDPTGGSRRDS